MKIGLVDHTTQRDAGDLVDMAAALTTQVKRDFAPYWHTKATVIVGQAEAVIELHDHSDQQGALGYHDFSADKPLAKVFVEDCLQDGVSVSSVVSHELLELLVDPEGVLAALDYRTGRFYAYEVCDPVQGKSYRINGVEVSDFVTPAWYSRDASGPYDHLGAVSAPFALEADRQGYDSILDVSNTAGWQQITQRSRWETGKEDTT